jgi:small subunit ribosomal protein S3
LLQASVVKKVLTDAIKMAIAASMRMNAEGIKVLISGRLNGAEMAFRGFQEEEFPSTFRY